MKNLSDESKFLKKYLTMNIEYLTTFYLNKIMKRKPNLHSLKMDCEKSQSNVGQRLGHVNESGNPRAEIKASSKKSKRQISAHTENWSEKKADLHLSSL